MDKRPETMERITNRALADKFIEEQLAEIKAQGIAHKGDRGQSGLRSCKPRTSPQGRA